jgi:hypothetical protein
MPDQNAFDDCSEGFIILFVICNFGPLVVFFVLDTRPPILYGNASTFEILSKHHLAVAHLAVAYLIAYLVTTSFIERLFRSFSSAAVSFPALGITAVWNPKIRRRNPLEMMCIYSEVGKTKMPRQSRRMQSDPRVP